MRWRLTLRAMESVVCGSIDVNCLLKAVAISVWLVR